MLTTLVGLWMLLAVLGGTATLVGVLLGRRLRARWDRRHPERAAARHRDHYQRRLAVEWPLLAQTLRLGYQDVWSRQHAYPPAEFVADDQGVTATVAAIAGAGLADYQQAGGYLADTWGLRGGAGRAARAGADPASQPAPRPAAGPGAG